MITDLTADISCAFRWIDVTDPTEQELQEIATRYSLHPASVSDCLQPGHLPKYEQFPGYTFIIQRVYNTDPNADADTVQELTGKIAMFVTQEFIITIHRKPWEPISAIRTEYISSGRCSSPFQVLNILIRTGLHSFDAPGKAITDSIDFYEMQVFLRKRKLPLLKGLYFMKRKLDVIRRLLLLTYDIVDRMDSHETANAYTRDVRDLYVRQKSLYDSMFETTNHLLNLYFNVSAQRTNETMRVLTIFSVFFMPLTFIAGVYGMNFHHMPELEWQYGYPMVMLLMVAVTILVFVWFKRKKWL